MRYLSFLNALLLSTLLMACNNSTSGDSTATDVPLDKEKEVVTKTTTPAPPPDEDLKDDLQTLEQLRNTINIQGRQLTEQELAITASIDNVLGRHALWVKQWNEAQLNQSDAAIQAARDTLAAIGNTVKQLEDMLERLSD